MPGSKAIYLKLKEREAFAFAITSVAAIVTLKDDLVSGARIALGGVGPAPLRATGAEAALKGEKAERRFGDRLRGGCRRGTTLGQQWLQGEDHKRDNGKSPHF